MSKKWFNSILLVLATLVIILSAVAGCSRPKPEAKETPTEVAAKVEPTNTPGSAPTQIVAEPTVVTTIPTKEAAGPTTAPAESGGAEATPTAVVIVPATAIPGSPPTAGEGSGEWFLYTVRYGDTLYSLAARYSTTVEVLSALNNLTSPDQLQAGQQIKIPQEGAALPQPGASVEYLVQAGDDLQLIANKFGVTVSAIVQANGIANPDFIYVGQKLVIPSGDAPVAAPSGGTVHVVKPGESVDIIASQYNTTREAIVAANSLVNANWIYVGQTLKIP